MFASIRFVAIVVGIAAFGVATPASVGAQSVINMSHDLVPLGIATQNMVPDMPALDARPLFMAAIEYAHTHTVERLTVDTGAYYFLTLEAQDRYTNIYALSDLEIDFAGSQVFFTAGFHQGFSIAYCNRLTLKNLTIDYLQPPYTHVQVTGVNAAARRFLYATLPGWPNPTTLNDAINPYGAIDLWAAVFRHGTFVPGTSRMRVQGPLVDGSIQLIQDGTPWTQPATLSTVQPGDTLVVTGRGGGPPVLVWRGDEVVLSNITVLGSSTWAISFDQARNSVGDRLRVMPRPGIGLVGSNGDGIHFARSLGGNVLRNSYVTRTLDDGIAIDSLEVATAPQRLDARHLRVHRFQYHRFPNGTALNFVDPVSTLEIPGATIIDQTPADSTHPGFGEIVDLTVDRDLPVIEADWKVVYAGAADRGAGSIIEDNTVEEVTGRNVWVSGTRGVTIRRNRVGAGSSGGIAISNEMLAYPGPPAHDITVDSNIMIGNIGPMAQESGSQHALGAIMMSTADNNAFALSHHPSNSGLTITNNFIADSGRAGVWVGELSGGEVRDNVIVRWNARPNLPYWGMNAADEQIARDDATLAVAVRFSENVNVSGNTTDLTSTLTSPVQLTPSSITLGRGAFQGSIGVESIMPVLSWAPRSNRAWITVDETPHTGTGAVDYAVAENTTGSTRTGRITIAGAVFQVTQTSNLVTVESITPHTGSGVAATFVAKYSSTAGAGDLASVRLRFATASNVGPGTCTVRYSAVTGVIELLNDAGTVWTPGSVGSGMLSNSQCSVNLASSTATPNANTLTLALNITFTSAFVGAKNIFMSAASATPPGTNTGWLLKGTWTVGPALDAVSITPNSGTGVIRTFNAAFTDSLTVSADLKRAMVRFGASPVNGCVVDYNAISATVRLFDDAGVPGPPSSFGSGTLTNSQCTLDLSQSSAAPSGTNLTLTLRLIFKAPLLGPQPIFMRATSNFGGNTGWIARGTWDVNAAVQAISVTPNAGSGTTQSFAFAFSDAEGVIADLKVARVRFSGGSGPCVIDYNAMTNQVRVQNDLGEWGTFKNFGSGTINNNGQCSLNLATSSAAPSGTNLTLTLALTFKPAFAGAKSIDMRANSNVGTTTGWIQRGTFTVTTSAPTNYDGSWSGTTSGLQNVFMTVANGRITAFDTQVHYTGTNCSGNTLVSLLIPSTISNGSASLLLSAVAGSGSGSATFSSPTTMSGFLSINVINCPTSIGTATFSLTKN